MTRFVLFSLCFCFVVVSAFSSGIPIWELLQYEEKLGRLLYVFVHIVEKCCKNLDISDCRKTIIMDGVSNLLNKTEENLDFLDPYQKNGHILIWEAATKSKYKCIAILEKNGSHILIDALYNEAAFDNK
ncbi:rhythmically expressed gene 5 protein-like [Centruroides vittatus]|uniref:rhythmically expressed gene 5 protein-like n=1 Tax=Centruroides vittatus TaxID=120091 RepID=UPI00351070DC